MAQKVLRVAERFLKYISPNQSSSESKSMVKFRVADFVFNAKRDEDTISLSAKICAAIENLSRLAWYGRKITIQRGEVSDEKLFYCLETIRKRGELVQLSSAQSSTSDDNNPVYKIENLILKIVDSKGLKSLQKIVATFKVLTKFDINSDWNVSLAGDMYVEHQTKWRDILGKSLEFVAAEDPIKNYPDRGYNHCYYPYPY